MAKGGSSGGVDVGLVVGNPILLVTILLSIIGWLVAFIGQCAAESHYRNGVLWFGIFVELFVIIGVVFTLATDSIAFARLQVAAFTVVALVYSVTGIDTGIYGGPSSVKAKAAGYFILTIVNVLWLLFFTAEEDSFAYNVLTSMGNGNLSGPGRSSSGGVRGQNIRVGGPVGGHSNGSAYSGGYGGATAASGYQPAYGNSPSAAELSSSGPKVAAASLRSGAPKSTGPGSQGHGGPGSDYGAVSSPISRGTGLEGTSTTPGGDPLPDYGYRAKALYAYQANADDPTELSFSKGEILDIVDNSGKWWQARTPNGETGIVPSNYMQLL